MLVGNVYVLLWRGQMSYQFCVIQDICPLGIPMDVHPCTCPPWLFINGSIYFAFLSCDTASNKIKTGHTTESENITEMHTVYFGCNVQGDSTGLLKQHFYGCWSVKWLSLPTHAPDAETEWSVLLSGERWQWDEAFEHSFFFPRRSW